MPICFGGAGRSTGNPLTDFIISPHAGKIKIFCGFLSRTSVSARLGARAPHGRGSRTFFSGENMKYTLHVTTFGRRTARWGSFELKICFRFGVQLQITAAHPRCSAAATRRRGRLPIKCKLSFSGDSFKLSPHATDVRLRAPLPEELRIIKCKLHPREMALMYRCTSPMLGRGDSPPPAAAKCEIKFVPLYARRHISHLRSKYFTSKIFHSFRRNEFH